MTGNPEVRVLTEVPGPWWDDLCRASGSPWHSLGMAGVHQAFGVRPFFLVCERDGIRTGVLSAYVAGTSKSSLADRAFMRTAYIPDAPALPAVDPPSCRALLEAADGLLLREGVVSASCRFEMPARDGGPVLRELGYAVSPHGISVLDLPDTAEAVDAMLHSKSRNLVRKAVKSGVEVREDGDLDVFLRLLDRSFSRSGLPARNHEYVRQVKRLQGVGVLTAAMEGRPIAGVMWMSFGTVACYMFHGRDDGETAGASNLLLREMFVRAVGRGARTVQGGDVALPGETDPHLLGITHFKTRMGFQVRETLSATKVFRPVARAIREGSLRVWNAFRT